ncbi:MAG: MepB family protein [Ginsengibacter sp.]
MELAIGAMPGSLQQINRLVFQPLDLSISNFILNKESKEYEACFFTLNGKNIIYRLAKITPTKTGQFVTIWKRNENGITVPFDINDDIHFVIIAVTKDDQFGQFIFPTSVLADKGIITQSGKEGKRGIRVYPPWDKANNEQAIKTQVWQSKYFFLNDFGKNLQSTSEFRKLLDK